jgi:multicomponent Na+:H+ antiporter subunit D
MTSFGASWLPLLVIASSLVTALLIFPLREEQVRLRTALNMVGATIKIVFVIVITVGFLDGNEYENRLSFLPGIDLLLVVSPISLAFAGLSSALWFVTTIYAIGYLEHAPNRSRFFGFFSLCVTATMGIALAGNLITFFIFYEMLTLTTYPLVVHRGTAKSIAAGRTYLLYTLTGGAIMLLGIIWLQSIAGPVEFETGGVLFHIADQTSELRMIFVLLVIGLGVKAAIVPLHGWLPTAMVAPAPVSALLHAVAVVKAGAYGILRFVYDLYGIPLAESLDVLFPLAIMASVTIIYGSIRALMQVELKRRLAFSTVSQVSYIVLGAAIVGPFATTGAIVHLMHQGLMKITLFFCAGNFAETLSVHRIDQMNGIGRRMPLTMGAFTVAAFGMIGAPPIAGFVSKWYLGSGGVQAGQDWVIIVLVTSTVLNAAYFLPVIYAGWFGTPDASWHKSESSRRAETSLKLLVPCLLTGLASLWAGLFAGSSWSPLGLATRIADELYALWL